MPEQLTYITAYDSNDHDAVRPPEKLLALIAWLQAKAEEIPPEYRADAAINIDAEHQGYGDYTPEVRITWVRPATAAEIEELQAAALRSIRAEVARAEQQLALALRRAAGV